MKARFILLVLGMMIFSSCGTYNTKIRFSSVEKEKKEVVHSEKDLGSTQSEELRNSVEVQSSESFENQEISTYDSAVDSQEEGVDGQKVEYASKFTKALKTTTVEKKAEQFENENTEGTKIHPLAIVGLSSGFLSAVLALIGIFAYSFRFWILIVGILLVTGIVTSIVAIAEIKRNPRYEGMGLAIGGLVISITVMLSLLLILIFLLLFASLYW